MKRLDLREVVRDSVEATKALFESKGQRWGLESMKILVLTGSGKGAARQRPKRLLLKTPRPRTPAGSNSVST